MIAVRAARVEDAAAIGAVHVAAWRSAYAGILPSDYLAGLSALRHAAQYHASIRGAGRRAVGVHVAIATVEGSPRPRVVGFVTASPVPKTQQPALADAEIETLYVLDDWRDQGVGRRLIRASAIRLRELGAQSVFVWVLRDNPSRWFYSRLGGRHVCDSVTNVAGAVVTQSAYRWMAIGALAEPAHPDARPDGATP